MRADFVACDGRQAACMAVTCSFLMQQVNSSCGAACSWCAGQSCCSSSWSPPRPASWVTSAASWQGFCTSPSLAAPSASPGVPSAAPPDPPAPHTTQHPQEKLQHRQILQEKHSEGRQLLMKLPGGCLRAKADVSNLDPDAQRRSASCPFLGVI